MARGSRAASVAMVVLLAVSGCRTTTMFPSLAPDRVREAVSVLSTPLPGDLSAIYKLRVPHSSELRLTILAQENAGRLTISEPFGSALSIVGWEPDGSSTLVDFREGCSLSSVGISDLLGVGGLPMRQAVLLIGGRFPAVASDRISVQLDGTVLVEGRRWACLVTLAEDPWRVVRVQSIGGDEDSAWSILLNEHMQSRPSSIRIDGADKKWVNLELRRLQWNAIAELAPLPNLEPCAG